VSIVLPYIGLNSVVESQQALLSRCLVAWSNGYDISFTFEHCSEMVLSSILSATIMVTCFFFRVALLSTVVYIVPSNQDKVIHTTDSQFVYDIGVKSEEWSEGFDGILESDYALFYSNYMIT
jgi:hypothetical protein